MPAWLHEAIQELTHDSEEGVFITRQLIYCAPWTRANVPNDEWRVALRLGTLLERNIRSKEAAVIADTWATVAYDIVAGIIPRWRTRLGPEQRHALQEATFYFPPSTAEAAEGEREA